MLINLVIKAPLVKGEGIRGWGDNIIGEILSGTDISCDRVETISANWTGHDVQMCTRLTTIHKHLTLFGAGLVSFLGCFVTQD